MNSILKQQDMESYRQLVQNYENRRAEEEQSLQNVENWRQEVYAMRIENIKTLKTSRMLSQKLVKDTKRLSVELHNDGRSVSSGSSFGHNMDGSMAVSVSAINTSSVVSFTLFLFTI